MERRTPQGEEVRKYTFQIKTCNDKKCCLPSKMPSEMLKWLPDPVLAEDRDHFKKCNEVTILISNFSEFKANSSAISYINSVYIFYIKG